MNINSDTRMMWLISIVLMGIYLLAYGNAPLSIDGADTLDVAATLVHFGKPAATQLTTSRQLIVANEQGEQYLLSADGERYSKKGIIPSLLLIPFVWLADACSWLSLRATAMLFNPIVTVATALVLWRFGRAIGFSSLVSTVVALVYGLATFSIVYVKTLFGEPLAGLLLILGLYSALRFRQSAKVVWLVVSACALALTPGINLSYTPMIIVVAVYALYGKFYLQQAVIYLLPTALTFALLGWLNWLRFGSPLETGYYLNSVEGFSTPLLRGLAGNWLSFYKGIFWFNPVLLLALPGWWVMLKRNPALAWVGLLLIVTQSVIYGAWWAWDGAWSWGPRFLLPTVPILMLFVASMLQKAITKRGAVVAIAGLIGLSAAVQIPGVLFDVVYFYENYFDDNLFNPRNNIILSILLHGSEYGSPDIALLQEGFDGLHGLAVMLCVALALVALWRLNGRRRAVAIMLTFVIACNVVAARQQQKPSFQLVREMEQIFSPPGTIFVTSFRWDTRLMDVENGSRFIVTNPHAPQDNALIRRQFEAAQARASTFWLVTWFPLDAPENWFAQELWETKAFVRQRVINEHFALWFDTGQPPTANRSGGWRFGDIELARHGLQRNEHGLYVTLEWRVDEVQPARYSWFVHLVDDEGHIIRQQDREPQGGYRPTNSWQPGEVVTDLLLFPVNEDIDWETSTLSIGYVNPASGERLPVAAPDGTSIPEGFVRLALTP